MNNTHIAAQAAARLKSELAGMYPRENIDLADVRAVVEALEAAELGQQGEQGEQIAGLERCEFDDECEFCTNPQGGSFTRLTHNAESNTEAEFYICGDCAWKAIDRFRLASAPAPALDAQGAVRQIKNAWGTLHNLSMEMERGPIRQQMQKRANELRAFLDAAEEHATPSPQAPLESKPPLSDEQHRAIWERESRGWANGRNDNPYLAYGRAIERAHGIGVKEAANGK